MPLLIALILSTLLVEAIDQIIKLAHESTAWAKRRPHTPRPIRRNKGH